MSCKWVVTLMKAISALFWCFLPRDEGMREDRYANHTLLQVLQLIISLDILSPRQVWSTAKKCFLYEFVRAKCVLGWNAKLFKMTKRQSLTFPPECGTWYNPNRKKQSTILTALCNSTKNCFQVSKLKQLLSKSCQSCVKSIIAMTICLKTRLRKVFGSCDSYMWNLSMTRYD